MGIHSFAQAPQPQHHHALAHAHAHKQAHAHHDKKHHQAQPEMGIHLPHIPHPHLPNIPHPQLPSKMSVEAAKEFIGGFISGITKADHFNDIAHCLQNGE
jgi:hypothetical protein